MSDITWTDAEFDEFYRLRKSLVAHDKLSFWRAIGKCKKSPKMDREYADERERWIDFKLTHGEAKCRAMRVAMDALDLERK